MKLNEQLNTHFTKYGHINASFYEGKACINVSLRFRTFYLSLDKLVFFEKRCDKKRRKHVDNSREEGEQWKSAKESN